MNLDMPKGVYDRSTAKLNVWNKGKRLSNLHKKRLSESHIGKTPWLGKKHTDLSKLKMSLARIGKRPANYIEDRIAVANKHSLRQSPEWRQWRETIFKRDEYTCQECRVVGGYLEPHHIVPLRVDMTRLFDVNNGITLCRPCHRKTMGKEERFEAKYLLTILK